MAIQYTSYISFSSEEDDDYEEEDSSQYEVIHAFNAEEDDDLTIEVGDIVSVIVKQYVYFYFCDILSH